VGCNPCKADLRAVLFAFPSPSGRLSHLGTPATASNPSGGSGIREGFFKADYFTF